MKHLDISAPADLDSSWLAGGEVATATGGMGSEKRMTGGPPIARWIVTGHPCPIKAIIRAVVFFPHPYGGKNLHRPAERQA